MRLATQLAIPVIVAFALMSSIASSALAAEGQIAGSVTSASTGSPIEGIEVCAYSEAEEEGGTGPGFFLECATTKVHGEYMITGLPSGEYVVEFAAPFESELDYITQYYDDKSSLSEANMVSLSAGDGKAGIDAELEEGGQIAGAVTSAATGEPIQGIEVCARKEGTGPADVNFYERCSLTRSGGEYTIVGLPSGKYIVEFASPRESNLNYVAQYYRDKSYASEANEVSVAVKEVTEPVDAELEVGGQIAGRVTDIVTDAGIEMVIVCAIPVSEGGRMICASTSSGGDYTISGLATGGYRVMFLGQKYILQYYDGVYAPGEAQVISVVQKSIVSPIDVALEPGPPSVPVNTGLPVVSGTPTAGDTLSCLLGSWTSHPPPTFTYQWLRDGIPITGANDATYLVQGADAGLSISCEVIAKNAVGKKRVISASVVISTPSTPVSMPPGPGSALVKVSTSRVLVKGDLAAVRITCARAACKGSIELALQVVSRRRGGRRGALRGTLVLAKGVFSVAAGRSATITLRLTATGRRRLAHAKRHPLAVELVLSTIGGTTTKSVRVS